MAKTKGQIKMTDEQKEAFDKVLRRRSIKKDQKGFDGVVSMRRHQNKVIVPEKKLEDRLWEAADHMRANSALRLNEFAEPVLGLIFLKFAGVKFSKTEKEISAERKAKTKNYGGASVARERPVSSADYHAQGTLYVPEKARFSYLIELPEGTDMGKAVNDAMKEIEAENKELAGILPKSFQMLENHSIITLLKNFNQIPDDIEGDAFGRIYEYFLGKFAIADGSGGGEFFTPSSIVKLIVEILEPFKGYIYDPACGSGGMFVQSVEFIKRHFENGKKVKASREVSIYGQEKTDQTVRIAKMNLAIHGLSGDIRQGNTYYEDLHRSVGKFDFAMANPPFNVNGIDKERIKDDPRFPYGIPRNDNGNYLWIQIFLSALKNTGRAGFVMANSASDAGHSEKEIRTKMIDDDLVDVMVAVGPNMFYNVTLPVTLWFLDKGKKKTDRKNKILFIDARNIYRQIDRAHRDWTNEQIEQIASIVRSYRGENGKKYQNVKGLCRVATIDEVKKTGYSLNPGRYVGVTDNGNGDERNFGEKVKKLHSELKNLTDEAHTLETKIFNNLKKIKL
jgi:type I restriction enzyme M protein